MKDAYIVTVEYIADRIKVLANSEEEARRLARSFYDIKKFSPNISIISANKCEKFIDFTKKDDE